MFETRSGGRVSLSLFGSSVNGTWREGSLAGDSEGCTSFRVRIGSGDGHLFP